MEDRSIAEFLGGSAAPMPATAIIGYPPASIGPKEIGHRWPRLAGGLAALQGAGWRRRPISAARPRAARAAAPEGWPGCDGAWIFDEVGLAAEFARSIYDVRLGWFEDIFPPGDAPAAGEARKAIDTPIAMGDEQGGAVLSQALIRPGRWMSCASTSTCMGGITGARRIVDECLARGGVRAA